MTKKKPTVKLSTEPKLRPKDIPEPIAVVGWYPVELAAMRGGENQYGEPSSTLSSTLDQSVVPLDARYHAPYAAKR